MGEKEKHLVVISVLEGRRLPRRTKHKIIAEAKFDGELLATDPVDHVENPDFTQELAWELDKKSLQQHRLQRASIKIQCYAYDAHSTLKELIGYVVLDLRSATTNKQCAKWYPLLHSKYHKLKPEIRLALYLDDDQGSNDNINVIKAQQSDEQLTNAEALDPKTLIPVLDEDEGFYQIGPADKCGEMFVLSVTVAYASNLAQLIPSNQPLSATSYFFYYSLLGNDVTNEAFTDLINTNFPAERASVKVRSSFEVLRTFLSNQPGIQFHLCCGDQSLGSCEVSLKTLLKKGSSEIYMRPISLEGVYQLVPPNKTKQQIGTVPDNMKPSVGISVVIKREDMVAKSPVRELEGNINTNTNVQVSPKAKAQSSPKSSPKLKSKTKKDVKGKEKRDGSPKAQQSKSKPSGENYSDDFEDEKSKESASLGEKLAQKAAKNASPTSSPKTRSHSPKRSSLSPGRESRSNDLRFPPAALAVPPQSHHFTFSIDLRSIKDTTSTNTQSIFIRYIYPFFGSAAPILTHPPVDVRKGMEVLLPQSFCAFDFACSPRQIQETFQRVPLTVEVWSRDENTKDRLLATARLPIADVLPVDRKRVVSDTGVNGTRQEHSDRIYVLKADGMNEHYGELFVVLVLEDWGPLPQQQIVTTTQQNIKHQTSNVQYQTGNHSIIDDNNYQQNNIQQHVSPRQTAEYQAALELEMWKENQEHAFELQLKQKEMSYMKALGEEWKKRDTEREVIMQKKVTEYNQLEEQLRKTLTDLEKREKQLAANEHEVMRLKTDLKREHDRKLQELKEASNRLKLDCDHQVQLEKMKVKELEDLIVRHKGEVLEAEKKYRNIDREFNIYKEQQNTKPEVRLQSEINLLTLEKVELERKLDAVTKSKVHYKQQWGRALKELARLKQKEQDIAKASLKRQQHELEHMRLRYLAAEEKEVVASEKKELEDIKNELNKLKQIEEGKLKVTGDSNDIHQLGSVKRLNTDLDNSIDDHITRLIEERDTLLRTGVYSTQDKIIAELDRQIRESMSQKVT
ncbi:hypothetical protein SNE40_011643 [Patella caerulea]|uniref:C2 domain-containing protein n=1 Tax=Patella caerulea TaxID=87958 RepID=A0AAN8JK77_PATCE